MAGFGLLTRGKKGRTSGRDRETLFREKVGLSFVMGDEVRSTGTPSKVGEVGVKRRTVLVSEKFRPLHHGSEELLQGPFPLQEERKGVSSEWP